MEAVPKNPKKEHKDLTAEDIKNMSEFKDITDELAQKIADTIRVYTEIIYNSYAEYRFTEQHAKIIQLTPAQSKKAA